MFQAVAYTPTTNLISVTIADKDTRLEYNCLYFTNFYCIHVNLAYVKRDLFSSRYGKVERGVDGLIPDEFLCTMPGWPLLIIKFS